MKLKKKLRIGFDLDGVIVGKPFFVPGFLMEALIRDSSKKALSYRFPENKFEQWARMMSHHPILRPMIDKNIKLIRELYKSRNYEVYAVSSRYSFLESRTKEWFEYNKLNSLFKEIYINNNNEQPHLYKKRMIEKLKLNVFIDDDIPLLEYLKKHTSGVELLYVDDGENHFKKKLA